MPMHDLLSIFDQKVAGHPQRIAIIDGQGHAISYASLRARSDQLAAAWYDRGIRKGDRVLLAMPLDADLYASLAALWRLGATVVLPEPAMGINGVRHAVESADVCALCAAGKFGLLRLLVPQLWFKRRLRPSQSHRDLPALPHSLPDDIALISFTSGTSGRPKAIPRSHRFLYAQYQALAPLLDSQEAERDLVAFPVFVLLNLAGGRTSILPNWKMNRLADLHPAQIRQWTEAQKPTRALLPPSLCEKLSDLDLPDSLHTIFTGGGPVFPNLIRALQGANPGIRICCVYGSTEAEPIAIQQADEITPDDYTAMRAGDGLLVGHPVAGLDLRIVEDEIQVSGAHVNEKYLDPKHDAENKVKIGDKIWHRTGDAGVLDDQGRLWLLGRVGTGGMIRERMVYPFAIETAARDWPGVRNCALIFIDGQPVLVIEGEPQHLSLWQSNAASLGISDIRRIAKMPTDKRHASKIDRTALSLKLT